MRWVGTWLLLAAASGAMAQDTVPSTYLTLSPVTQQVDIAPGATGTLQFEVRMGSEAGAARFVLHLDGPGDREQLLNQYAFIPQRPEVCGPVREITVRDHWSAAYRIEFPIAPQAAHATVRCTYQVRRQVHSDLSFSLGYYRYLPVRLDPLNSGGQNYPEHLLQHYGLIIGSLTDLSVHAVPAGSAQEGYGLYRLSIRNLGAYDVGSESSIQSGCQPIPPEPGLVYETDFPGGCPMRERSCDLIPLPGHWMTQRSIFNLGTIRAGQEQSCLVRIRNHGNITHADFNVATIDLSSRRIDAAAFDRNSANDRVRLQLPPYNAPGMQQASAPTAIPVGDWLVPGLLLLFMLTARAHLRRATPRPRRAPRA